MSDSQQPQSLSISSVIDNAEGASIIKSIYLYLISYCLIALGTMAFVSYLNGGFRHFVLLIMILYLVDKADKFKNGRFSKLSWFRNLIIFLVCF